MEIREEFRRDIAVLTVALENSGDALDVERRTQQLANDGIVSIVVDFSESNWTVQGDALGVFSRMLVRMRDLGGDIRLSGLSPRDYESTVITLLRDGGVFRFYDTIEDAVESFRHPPGSL